MATLLYVGTEEGVFTLRKENGSAWAVARQGLTRWDVPALAVDAAAPNRLLAATRGDGVWLSEDGGEHWTKPCYGKRGPGQVRCLTIDPHDPRRVYAGDEPIDLFVSEDFGTSWEALAAVRELPFVEAIDYPLPTVEPHVRDVVVDPRDPRTLYAALQVGSIIKSTDGGQTWKLLDDGVDTDVHTIVVDPRDSDRLVVATGGYDFRRGRVHGRALYSSADAGESWTPLAAEFPEDYGVPLVVQPGNPDVWYAAIANGDPSHWQRPGGAEALIIRSRDGGRTWQATEVGRAERLRGFPEAIAFAGESNQVFAGFRGGEIYGSDDGGESWAPLDVRVPRIWDLQCVEG
jgi:photosystem II stability/assembly factor-like uncharacterized protein